MTTVCELIGDLLRLPDGSSDREVVVLGDTGSSDLEVKIGDEGEVVIEQKD